MDVTDLCYLSAVQLSHLIKRKEIGSIEVFEAHLNRFASLEPILNSFITPITDQAMAAAREAERKIQEGRYRSSLHGIPVGVRDVFYLKGVKNTCGMKILESFVPHFNSPIMTSLIDAGAIIMAKLNRHPLGYGATGENPEYGHMRNPWNPELIPGGSSGGSTSAVASGGCPLSKGTDTGGSDRLPASLCGPVALKPNYGRLSRHGVTALPWSQDCPCPISRTVEDCALVMNSIAGYDPNDSASSKSLVPDYTKALPGEIKDFRIGVPKQFLEVPLPLDSHVKKAVWKAIEKLAELGATIHEVSCPMFHEVMAIASTIQMAEAAACHSELVKSFGPKVYPPVRLRLEVGFFVSAACFIQAQRARTLFRNESFRIPRHLDLVAGPTVPVTAMKMGATEVEVDGQKMKTVLLLTQYPRPLNLNGLPAETLPRGFSNENLPIGLQLAGTSFAEEKVLQAAYAFERATEWHKRRPPI